MPLNRAKNRPKNCIPLNGTIQSKIIFVVQNRLFLGTCFLIFHLLLLLFSERAVPINFGASTSKDSTNQKKVNAGRKRRASDSSDDDVFEVLPPIKVKKAK